MPLLPGKKNGGHNIEEMEDHGHPRDHFIEAALQVARKHNAHGGLNMLHVPHIHSKKLRPPHSMHTVHQHTGAIHSSVAGRTDHLPMHVPSGAYVVPADVVSGMGEGNTIAGFKHMRRIFGDMPRGAGPEAYGHVGGPYGQSGQPYGHTGGPYGMATGGGIKHRAAGVLVVSPEDKILLMRRAGKDHAGEWALPGGGIEKGETSEEAARRELREETGHEFKGQLTPATRRKKDGVDFTTFLAHAEPFQPKLNDEHDAHAWVSRKDALNAKLHPGVKETLETLERPLKADGGEVSENLENFMKDAHPAMKNANSTPKTWYHGTPVWGAMGNIQAFDRKHTIKTLKKKPFVDHVGSWFSDKPDESGAGMYAGSPGAIYPVHLGIKNPWRPKNHEEFRKLHDNLGSNPDTTRDYLRQKGHDGILFPRGAVDSKEQQVAVALNPHQIKSAVGNRGTYDPNQADITKASGGGVSGVPIIAAGGEWVVHPDSVKKWGGGDLDTGHRVMDKWVVRMRKELIETLKKLPGPKKD